MNYTTHQSNNGVLGAPEGWDQEGALPCGALPVTHCVYEGGVPGVQSFWKPEPAEIEALKAGALIVLSIVGETHAPVMVGVAKPESIILNG